MTFPPYVEEKVDGLKFFDYQGHELVGDTELIDKKDIPLPSEGPSSEENTNSSISSIVNDSSELDNASDVSRVPEDDKVNDEMSTTSTITTHTPFEASDLVSDEFPLNDYLVDEDNRVRSFQNDSAKIPFSGCDKIPVVSQTQDDSEEERTEVQMNDGSVVSANPHNNDVTHGDDFSVSSSDSVVSSTDEVQPSVSNSVNDHFANIVENDDEIQCIINHR